jgi:sensor histidine kinase regulating citrate/malate metabolism
MDVVRSEIAALGGSIVVSSQRGEGTCFTIRLPHDHATGAGAEQNCEASPVRLQ